MKALVTGCGGFVGRHMVNELKERDWDVYGIELTDGEDAVDFFTDRDYDENFDLIVHCAYRVGGRAAIDGINMNLAENLMLDASLFNWALRTYQGAVLYFSSSAAYPINCQTKEYIETDGSYHRMPERFIDLNNVRTPDSNYGWAKLTGERLARQFADNGGRVHVVRPFSGYGSDQSLDYPFPSIIRRAQAGDLTVWGPPGQTRDWIHISDVVRGALAVYDADERRPVNLCTGVPTEMGQLMRMAFTEYQLTTGECKPCKITYLEDKPTGVFHRVGDPTRLHEIYEPKIDIEEGVRLALGC